MKLKQKLILRHKNPIGLALRVLTYAGIAICLWLHRLDLIFILVLVDVLNWFCMPMVKPENEIAIVQKIVQAEIDWIKSPWSFTKVLSVIIIFLLFGVLGVGLWMHHWFFITVAFILVGILKQLILKN